MKKNKTVVFILCPGRSGSTILGYFLGAHSKMLHMGEIPAPLGKGKKPHCLSCSGQACPVWSEALSEKGVLDNYMAFCASKKKRGKSVSRSVIDLFHLYRKPGAIHQRLFEAFPQTDVIIDGSKNIQWAAWNQNNQSFDVKFIYLTRDMRAVVNSMRRSRNEDVGMLAKQVIDSHVNIQGYLVACRPENTIQIKYEDFCLNPKDEGERLCSFLNLKFEHGMLNYYQSSHHVIGGNAGPTYQGLKAQKIENDELSNIVEQHNTALNKDRNPGIFLDNSWLKEMSADMQDQFQMVGGEYNRSLGYTDEPTLGV